VTVFLDLPLRRAHARPSLPMPTHGTHTPDVTYRPSSDMAWGARGNERMKSASDREYEERVRTRQRRCSIVPGSHSRKRMSLLDVAFNAACTLNTTSKLIRWLLKCVLFVHEKMFGIALVALGKAAPRKGNRAF